MESVSRIYGGYPGLPGHRGPEKKDEDDNIHDLSDDIDVETDTEAPPRLVHYTEWQYATDSYVASPSVNETLGSILLIYMQTNR